MATMSPAPAASILAPAAVLTAIAVTYWPLAGRLVTQWATDDNYSHGFIVIPLASYFVWRRRAVEVA